MKSVAIRAAISVAWPGFAPVTTLALLTFACAAGCDHDSTANTATGEELSGGETTVFDVSREAFSLAARNLKGERRDAFFVGNSFFNRGWVAAPASTVGIDGLGPTFNVASCSGCHFKDGRAGSPDTAGDRDFVGLLLRLSVAGEDAHGGPAPDPNYGGQFNHRAILGVPAEGKSAVTYAEVEGRFGDQTPYSLRHPTYHLSDLAFGALAPGAMISPRIAPAMIGLGLLEAVPEADVVARADEEDRDRNGISGKPNRVWDEKTQTTRLGRFGWKANQPGLEQQNAGAFLGDMGITSPLFPTENCPPVQTACLAAFAGDTPDLPQDKLDSVTYYTRLLAVPARRDWRDPKVVQGRRLFGAAGCASCHSPELLTGEMDGVPEISHQIIRPYTDLLLHDMGDDLRDDRPDYLATGREWRTPPLWGIGLLPTVNGHSDLLHDGRARGLGEAILWHGGEAEASRERFRQMAAPEREAMIRFLESL